MNASTRTQTWSPERLREEIRQAGGYRCGYCKATERDFGGTEHFGIDHFRPKSLFPDLTYDRDNLVYCCHSCNMMKSNRFQENDGIPMLLHPRRDDYAIHITQRPDGTLVGVTERGKHTIALLGLNRVSHVSLRHRKIALRQRYNEILKQLSREIEQNEAEDGAKSAGHLSSLVQALTLELEELQDYPWLESARIENAVIETIDWVETAKQLSPYLIALLKSNPTRLDALDPYVFEQLVAEFFASQGCSVTLLGRNPRTGADIMAVRTEDSLGFEVRYLIEVKRHRDKIGIEEIHRVYGVMMMEKQSTGSDLAIIVSLSGFTEFRGTDVSQLRNMGIDLKGREHVVAYLRSYRPRPDGGLWLPSAFMEGN